MIKNIIYILLTIIFLFLYLRYYERSAVFHPMKEIELIPTEVGFSYEDVYFDTVDGVRLNGWLIPAEDSGFTILFCHGNAGNISHRLEKILILNKLGLDVFIFDYRGYGRSSGRPSEAGLYKDVEAAYNYLVFEKKIAPGRIISFGESLGGSVAVELASRKEVKALIIESTFSCTKDVAKVVAPLFPTFILAYKFDSVTKIKDIAVPKLIIHSKNDEIVPFSQSKKLFEASCEPKRHLVLIGGHNALHMDSKDLYVSGIKEFLESL